MSNGKWTSLRWKLSGKNGNNDTHVHPDMICDGHVLKYLSTANTLKTRRKCCILLPKIAAFARIEPSPGNDTVHFSRYQQNVQIPKSRGNLQEPGDLEAGSEAASCSQLKFCLSRHQKNKETPLLVPIFIHGCCHPLSFPRASTAAWCHEKKSGNHVQALEMSAITFLDHVLEAQEFPR